MIDDQIRKYVRTEINENDRVEVKITRIAINTKGSDINPMTVLPINISARGLMFESEIRFTVGIMLDLYISIEDKTIQTTGKIVRIEEVDKKYRYAITFSLLKEYNVIIISSFVKRKTIDHIQQMRG